MPDWSYRTVFRPILFGLPAGVARDLTLGVMGTLARTPIGPFVIDFMGHMRADPRLATSPTALGLTFETPVGLGCGIDTRGLAIGAIARFGVGFLEVGPVTAPGRLATGDAGEVERRVGDETIGSPWPPGNPGVESLARQLAVAKRGSVKILARLAVAVGTSPSDAAGDLRALATRLGGLADAFVIDAVDAGAGWDDNAWDLFLPLAAEALGLEADTAPALVVVSPQWEARRAAVRVKVATRVGFRGVLIDGAVRDEPGFRGMGPPAREPSLAMARHLRQAFGPGLAIVAGGGVREPIDALMFKDAGADLVTLDAGLVYSGPGLPKRINEALIHDMDRPSTVPPPERASELAWPWLLLMGLSMVAGSVMALAIAATRVVLPYDEQFVNMSRDAIAEVNPNLLAFMTHDRVTLAGTMSAVGVLYVGLAWSAIRRGTHWAWVSVLCSAYAGFASFFLFLGFGYFDPFHAFVTLALLQLLLLGRHGRLGTPRPGPPPDLWNTPRWRRALWGQLILVAQAGAFLVAGATICVVGMTSVFVPEDLEFLQTTGEAIAAANPRLPALVAHDRASFGGMLIASGLVFLTSALWGIRRGERWLWWSTLFAGLCGYLPAVVVHYHVGYRNTWHLLPAFLGFFGFLLAMGLLYAYLCRDDSELIAAWGVRKVRVRGN